ncbi:hypothetical protein CR513_28013, partial [Mucuna pruriens]
MLKELATPNVVYQPWCIQYPQLEPAQSYELKSSLIHLLPKFHGLVGEDPYKHLKEFHVVCSTMRPQGISEDYIKMKAFQFSLDGAAKDWLYLQLVLFNTWGDMKHISSRHPELRPSEKKFVGLNILKRHCTNIGKDLTSYVPLAHIIRSVPLPFPTQTLLVRKAETDEDLLKMFQKVEINIPLLDTIKQIPKYAKFLKELCVYKRKKMKGEVELGGVVSSLTKK